VPRCLPAVALAGMLVAAGCGSSSRSGEAPLNVVTTVAPITSIAANIGGDRVRIHGVVPEGTNSHTFEPVPSQAKVLAQADVIFLNGLDLEDPTKTLAEATKRAGTAGAKGTVDPGEAEKLLQKIAEIDKIFWETKQG